MTPKHRSIVREAWLQAGQKGSAQPANPFSKTGAVAGFMQEWIGKNYPVEAAEMRLENNPDGLCLDAQCVIDGTFDPEIASDDVMRNLFEYSPKYTRHLISQEKAAFDQRVSPGEVSIDEMLMLQAQGDPRGDELKAEADAARAKAKENQASLEASLLMQSAEQARHELKARALQSGRRV